VSPRNDGAPAGQQGRTSSRSAGQRDHDNGSAVTDETGDGALFPPPPVVVVTTGTYGERIEREVESFPAWMRGPAPKPRPTPPRSSTLAHADPAWVRAASARVKWLASTDVTFTADDVRDKVPTSPADARALGALFSEFAGRGQIVCVGLQASATPSRRGGALRVWRGRAR